MRIEKVRAVILGGGKRLETAIYADESDTAETLANKAKAVEKRLNDGKQSKGRRRLTFRFPNTKAASFYN